MARILHILPGIVPPEADQRMDPFFHISASHEGDVLLPIGWKMNRRPRTKLVGNFTYHFTYNRRLRGPIRALWDMVFMVTRGLYLHYFGKKFDVIVTYGTNTTGIAALVLKCLTRAKLITEMPLAPQSAYCFDSQTVTWRTRLKDKRSRHLVQFVLRFTDYIRLGYPQQLNGFSARNGIGTTVFHYFVPVSAMQPTGVDDKYILLLGHPWYLKGVDLLIKAFLQVAEEFPEYRLKIVGHCRDRGPFEQLRAGHPRIEFSRGVPYSTAMELVSSCSVLVLPSRTEAMGRVLLEAMAFSKPIVASNVDGIPHYIKDGDNGLLFETENVDQLASKLRRLLSDRKFAAQIAQNAHQTVHARYSEARYAERFDEMIDAVTKRQ